jgi:Tol biopolymer transport system component
MPSGSQVPTTAATSPAPQASLPSSVVGDGEPWIAFQWQRGQGDAVFLMRPDGTGTHPLLAAISPQTFHPDWSPDGARIAYEAAGAKADDIWIVDADGSGATVLVDRNAECGRSCGDAAYPAWSPDGRSIAFIRFDFAGDVHVGCTLEVIDVADASRRTIYAGPAGTVLDYPRWSGDGRSIVFEATTFPDPSLSLGKATGSTIAVIDAVKPGAKPRVLTEPKRFATYPDWSRAGDLIVYTTYDLGEFQATDQPSNLYTVKPDGSGMTALTSYGAAAERATQPSWTPDGGRILFTLVGQDPTFDNPRHAAFIDAGGANLVKIPGSATHPRLRPSP